MQSAVRKPRTPKPRSSAAAQLSALAELAVVSQSLTKAQAEYDRASGAWARFAATHGHDDPAHAEHHQRTVAAKTALQAAREAYAHANQALANALPTPRRQRRLSVPQLRKLVGAVSPAKLGASA